MLPDGQYDAIVVDAHDDAEGTTLELSILAGAHKGEVVVVRARGLGLDEVALLAAPATLTVENGVPSVALDL